MNVSVAGEASYEGVCQAAGPASATVGQIRDGFVECADTTIAFLFATDQQTATVVSVGPGVTAVKATFGTVTGSAIVVVDTLP